MLQKQYPSGAQTYVRPITKPVPGSVLIAVGGERRDDVAIDPSSGRVLFATAPGSDVPISAGFEFDVPVRFDTDRIQTGLSGFAAGEIPSIPIVEIRV